MTYMNKEAPATCGSLDDLTFVGFKFIGDAYCVPASKDSEASAPCAGGMRYVNPANPQYNNSKIQNGSRKSNPQGYYYCVADDVRNHKDFMCRVLAPLKYPTLSFNFSSTGDGDGDCMCGTDSHSLQMCNNPDSLVQNAAAHATESCSGNPNVQPGQAVSGDVARRQLAGTDANAISSSKFYCPCSASSPAPFHGKFAEVPVTESSCTGGASATAAAQAVSTNNEFNSCLARYRQKAMDCQEQADDAKKTCDDIIKNAKNSPLNMAGALVNAAGQVGIASNAGSGNQQKCFGAGVGMMGTREALKLGKPSCEADFGQCRRTCSEDTFNQMKTECPAKLVGTNGRALTEAQLIQAGQTSNDPNAANAQAFASTRDELRAMFQSGREKCQNDAGGANADISSLMSGLGNSLKNSMVCACNLSTSPGINCQQIPTIDTCESNPTTPNCQVYSAVDTCNPTSVGYNQQQCACLQNPNGCSTISGTPGPSMFGGNLAGNLTPTAGGGSGFAGGISGGGGGHYGVDGGSTGVAQAFLGRGSDPSTMGGGGGGAGFGGGGAGIAGAGGSGNGPLVDGGKSEEKGIAGLFNQAKNFVSRAFGSGKSTSNGKATAGKGSGKDDLSRFKPRGLASAGKNGMGTANMDIFGMIKLCATGETCISNQPANAWILTP
jgi:hypothetical protein